MNLYKAAEKDLRSKYDVDLLEQIVLARNDRAVYYVEFEDGKILFTKIHGKSPMDFTESGNQFPFDFIEENFYMESKYGEVAGQEYYKKTNLDLIRNMTNEANITIPISINHQRFWVRFHLYTTLSNENGSPKLASCYITDVTKYLINEENLFEKTHKDELTGLFNRYTLHYHFEIYGSKKPIIGMYYDIDDFKGYNDTYGHDFGDKVLVKLSENLLDMSEHNVKSYRLGGDEFFTLVFEADLNKIEMYIKKIQHSMTNIKIPKIDKKLSLSVGCVYTISDITHKSEPFIKEADRLMYVSKKNGKAKATKSEFIVFG